MDTLGAGGKQRGSVEDRVGEVLEDLVVLAAVIGELYKSSAANANIGLKTCVVAHRDELTAQNEAKFRLVNPGISTSIFDAGVKSYGK